MNLPGESILANLLNSKNNRFFGIASPLITMCDVRPCGEMRAHNEQFLKSSNNCPGTFWKILLNNDQSDFDSQIFCEDDWVHDAK